MKTHLLLIYDTQNNTSGASVSGRVCQRDMNIQPLYQSMHLVKLLYLVERKWTAI